MSVKTDLDSITKELIDNKTPKLVVKYKLVANVIMKPFKHYYTPYLQENLALMDEIFCDFSNLTFIYRVSHSVMI